jgi:hypothetical protein
MSADGFIQLHYKSIVFYKYNAAVTSGQIIVIFSTDLTWNENKHASSLTEVTPAEWQTILQTK